MKKRVSYLCATTAALGLLPACDWFAKPTGRSSDMVGSGEALICFGSKTVMSVDDFRKKLKMLQESQPGIENILAGMPEQEQLKVYAQFAESCASDQIIREYIKEKGLDQTAEYKALEKQVHEAVDGNLRMNEFQKELAREVTAAVDAMSDADLRAYYEAHRDKDPMFKREPFMMRGSKDDKGAPKYAEFDAAGVREALKQVMQQVKFGELFQAKMEELKSKYGARIEMRCLQEFVVKQAPQAQEQGAGEEQSAPEQVAAQQATAPRQSQTA